MIIQVTALARKERAHDRIQPPWRLSAPANRGRLAVPPRLLLEIRHHDWVIEDPGLMGAEGYGVPIWIEVVEGA